MMLPEHELILSGVFRKLPVACTWQILKHIIIFFRESRNLCKETPERQCIPGWTWEGCWCLAFRVDRAWTQGSGWRPHSQYSAITAPYTLLLTSAELNSPHVYWDLFESQSCHHRNNSTIVLIICYYKIKFYNLVLILGIFSK